MGEVRALSICYRLLSRMDRRGQDAAMKWLADRLAADRESAKVGVRGIAAPDKALIRKTVGDATMSLMALLKATGASSARRPIELRGSVNADVLVTVKPVQ